jgi:hypothetical protein
VQKQHRRKKICETCGALCVETATSAARQVYDRRDVARHDRLFRHALVILGKIWSAETIVLWPMRSHVVNRKFGLRFDEAEPALAQRIRDNAREAVCFGT